MRTDNIKNQSGFTLIELLVVLFLFALLSIALFAALRFGSMTLDRITIHQHNVDDLSTSENMLSHWLEGAYPKYIPAVDGGIPGHVDFNGEQRTMTFLTQTPLSIAPGGMARMELSVQKNGAVNDVVLSARPELAWSDENDTIKESLITGTSTVTFAYWGADNSHGSGYWHRSWNNRATLPQLIRITVKFPAGDLRKWPDFLISPMIYVDQGCQFISLTQTCLGR